MLNGSLSDATHFSVPLNLEQISGTTASWSVLMQPLALPHPHATSFEEVALQFKTNTHHLTTTTGLSDLQRLRVRVSQGKVNLNRSLHPATESLVLLPNEPMSEAPMASGSYQLLAHPVPSMALIYYSRPGLWMVDTVA